jgi:hypothetical protein
LSNQIVNEFNKDYQQLRQMFVEAKKLYGNNPVVGAEVGTSAGKNAVQVLNEWKEITKLWCIDYYPTYSDFIDSRDQEVLRNCAVFNFATQPKTQLIIDLSTEAAKRFEDESLDFVYIDANHSYKYVREDILAWLPKVKKGGIIGGHDYDWTDKEDGNILAVKKAVDEIFGTDGRVHYHIEVFGCNGVLWNYNWAEPRENAHAHINSDWWVFL